MRFAEGLFAVTDNNVSFTNMNNTSHIATRAYRMSGRAEKAAENGQRILLAAHQRFATLEYDQVVLAEIAGDAGVTEQTVIRRFGNKEKLFAALVEQEIQRVGRERVPPANGHAGLERAVSTLIDHYEKDGRVMLNFLKQEGRSPILAEVTQKGRELHEQWVRTYCQDVIGDPQSPASSRRIAAAVAASDLYIWKLLRLDRGLSRAAVEQIMLCLLRGIPSGCGS